MGEKKEKKEKKDKEKEEEKATVRSAPDGSDKEKVRKNPETLLLSSLSLGLEAEESGPFQTHYNECLNWRNSRG